MPCDFENPDLAESLWVPETPLALSSPNFCVAEPPLRRTSICLATYAHSRRSSVTVDDVFPPPSPPSASECCPSRVHATPAPDSPPRTIPRNPDPAPLSATSRNDRLMELRLLHHYTNITYKSLVLGDKTEDIWRDMVPNIAFSGNHFLADGLLAVSALHLRLSAPDDRSLIRASHLYMASTLSQYGASLSKGINESNAEALFLTAALIGFQSAASRIFTRDDSGDVRDRSDEYVLPLSWFHSFQGVKTIVASSWQYLRNSSMVLKMIMAQPMLKLDFRADQSTFFGYLLDGLDQELETMEPNLDIRRQTRQAYLHAVAVLNWTQKVPETGAPMIFLATVSRRYVELLQAHRPRALVILAAYFGLLRPLESHVWWLKGVTRREVMGITSLFNPSDDFWWPRLQWAIRIALHEGDKIPPHIWGVDVVESPILHGTEKPAGEGFITHIELLTEMFKVMTSPSNSLGTTTPEAAANMYSILPDLMDHVMTPPDMASDHNSPLTIGLHVPPVD